VLARHKLSFEKLDEPVEVIAHFAERRISPIRFLWKGRPHKIEAVRGRWTTMEGLRQRRHFAVSAGGVGACELTFDVESMEWRIRSVAIG
ncbi:MAG: hypothetical protein V2A61_06240, partial [Calditrichota bacterium]